MNTDLPTDKRTGLRRELGQKVALYLGSEEQKVTEVPGLTLVRRTTVSAPVCATYEPSIAVITQGRKRVELGSKAFIYDESHYLLTSVDLPIVSQLVKRARKSRLSAS